MDGRMDMGEVRRRIEAVEAAAGTNRASEKALSDELDRLAEHLIGESAPELQQYKERIQALAVRVDPASHAAADVQVYVETYCHYR